MTTETDTPIFSEKIFIKHIRDFDIQKQLQLCKEKLNEKHYYLINNHYNKCINELYKSITTNKITNQSLTEYLNKPTDTEDYTLIYLLCKLHLRNRECLIKRIRYTKNIIKDLNYIMKPNQHSYILVLNEYNRQYKYNTIIYRIKDKSVMKYLDTIPINNCIFINNKTNNPIETNNQMIQKIKSTFISNFNSETTENEIYKLFKNETTECIRKRQINSNTYDTLTDYIINDL